MRRIRPRRCTGAPASAWSFLPTHLLTYSPTHLLTYSPTHLLTYSPTHLLTYSPKKKAARRPLFYFASQVEDLSPSPSKYLVNRTTLRPLAAASRCF